MSEFLWRLIAWVISRKPVTRLLVAYAKRQPYLHLSDYMHRWWIWNPYNHETHKAKYPRLKHSARVHHILREDRARDPHDHPWAMRTIILDGWYIEERDDGLHLRKRGDTASLNHLEFHNIKQVSPGGVYTLFITGPYMHRWGFRLEDGSKVPYTEYLKQP